MRTLLVVTAVLGAFIGWWVRLANQRDAVAEIRRLTRTFSGSSVLFHYSHETIKPAAPFWKPDVDKNAASWVPEFLLEGLGKDLFHEIRYVRVYQVHDDHRQKLAEQIARLSDLRHLELLHVAATDAMVERLVKLRELQTLQLRGDSLTDETFRLISSLPRLEALEITGSFTDEGLSYLSRLKTLKCLTLQSTRITGQGLAAIGELPKLQTVQLKSPLPEGLAALADCKALTSLSLSRANASDRDLEQIARFTSLERLDLSGNKLTGSELRHLHGLRNLRELDLSACAIVDDSIKFLSPLSGLEKLDLSDSMGLTNGGMAALARLSNLQELDLDRTSVSLEGIFHLKKLTRLRRLIVPTPPPCGTGALERELLGLPPLGLSRGDLKLLQIALPGCKIEFQP